MKVDITKIHLKALMSFVGTIFWQGSRWVLLARLDIKPTAEENICDVVGGFTSPSRIQVTGKPLYRKSKLRWLEIASGGAIT